MPQPYIDFAFVKANARFEPVLQHYNLPLLGTGSQRTIKCPFHDDHKPSCKIELDRRIFHCFACEAHGNLLEFVAKLDNSDLRAAATKVAELCNIELAPPPQVKAATKANAKPKKAPSVKRAAAPAPEAPASPAEAINPPLAFQLKLDPEHPYLKARGLAPELVAEFGLGYAARGSMAGRLAIPLHDERGELIAYAGRWAADDVPEDIDRYLLPKGFHKQLVLFNLHRIADVRHIVLVEGFFGAFRLHALGAPVAALMGSSISPAQIALLRDRGTRSVTALFDGDEPGRKARERALPDLAAAFFARAPLLPEGTQPDTLSDAELRRLLDPNT